MSCQTFSFGPTQSDALWKKKAISISYQKEQEKKTLKLYLAEANCI